MNVTHSVCSWWLAELVNNVDGRETESMKLLKNILPESIIARMQQGQKFVADSHGHVVILFSDVSQLFRKTWWRHPFPLARAAMVAFTVP